MRWPRNRRIPASSCAPAGQVEVTEAELIQLHQELDNASALAAMTR
jgi:hypothetical protein